MKSIRNIVIGCFVALIPFLMAAMGAAVILFLVPLGVLLRNQMAIKPNANVAEFAN